MNTLKRSSLNGCDQDRVPFLSTFDFEQEKDSGIDRALEVLNN